MYSIRNMRRISSRRARLAVKAWRGRLHIPIRFREEHFMPPLYTLSFQRSQLENAYLCVDDDNLLFMSQSLDQMILRAQRVRKANFRRLALCARRPHQLRASLITPFR